MDSRCYHRTHQGHVLLTDPVTVDLLGTRVSLSVHHRLWRHLAPSLEPLTCREGPEPAHRVVASRRRRGWAVDGPSGSRHIGRSDSHALYEVLTELNDIAAATAASSSAVIHGAAVVAGGGAICLVGPSGAGKSTLAAALTLAGAPLLAEEVCAIDADSLLHPFPRPIGMRARSAHLLGIRVPDGPFEFVYPWRAPTLAAAPARVAHIMLLHRVEHADPEARRLPPDEALLRLAQNTLGAAGAEIAMFRRVERVARTLPVWELTYADAHHAAHHLLHRFT